ncbi:YrdB family protein [Paenibacillus sp.]|uniref:YrdB family protein n=1 Tax=Paenibacillus sp. TaxID=58172 RepID=UPI002D21F071|nr:YrdB family protein [Paenibacillus sp.]HZG84580.1 YrdB family protein [Paenibacillus sp.]
MTAAWLEGAKALNLAARFGLELCALAAVGYWGFRAGGGGLRGAAFAVAAVAALAAFWGLLGSPNAPVALPPAAHALVELTAFGLPAALLFAAGKPGLAAAYAAAAIVNRLLMAVWNQ